VISFVKAEDSKKPEKKDVRKIKVGSHVRKGIDIRKTTGR
jgi:hypothetical protein